MESLQSQLSHVQQNQSSVDSNWNDKVLEKVSQDHGWNTKQEAVVHLDTNHAEGEQALRTLVGEKYGREIPSSIGSKGDALTSTVDHSVPSQPMDYNKGQEKLHSAYDSQVQADQNAQAQELQRRVEERVADTSHQKVADEMRQKVDGALGNAQEQFEKNKGAFDSTSESTIKRTGQEAWKKILNML